MKAKSDTTISGRIETKAYNDESLPDGWSSLSESEKLEVLRDMEPDEQSVDYNTTTEGMHEYFAINLDGSQSVNLEASHLALGTDDTTTPDPSDTSLNSEYFRTTVSDWVQTGNQLQVDTLIQSGEANGSTIREVGLFTDSSGGASERMLNHSLIADIEKDSTRNITIEVTLTFNAA